MKLLAIVVLSVALFAHSGKAAPKPLPQTYIPGTIQWFCAPSSDSSSGPGSSDSAFGDWLRNVVQPWLPPAVCKTVLPSASGNSSGASAASWLDMIPMPSPPK
ncbi:AAEL000886-PA [Aedes aegypti]|uniref:AAEL000886-PA n=2 Tax=Aedes aegypti TaxID=7159 RepID=A0A1S4EX50_AEDAE|nr:uncharacterized protein LOC5567196 [Aedes aegypti]EAT48024.1 AAEL000886-PA [Aedes aegypti]